jgi:hypothetical protein
MEKSPTAPEAISLLAHERDVDAPPLIVPAAVMDGVPAAEAPRFLPDECVAAYEPNPPSGDAICLHCCGQCGQRCADQCTAECCVQCCVTVCCALLLGAVTGGRVAVPWTAPVPVQLNKKGHGNYR